MPYPDLKMLIAGEWTDGSSGKSEPVICPADGSTRERCHMPARLILMRRCRAALTALTSGER